MSTCLANLGENKLQTIKQPQPEKQQLINQTFKPLPTADISMTTTNSGATTSSTVFTSSSPVSGVASQQQSPRNTSTMSTGGTCVQLGIVEVSKSLQDGEKFVKWDEVSQIILYPHCI